MKRAAALALALGGACLQAPPEPPPLPLEIGYNELLTVQGFSYRRVQDGESIPISLGPNGLFMVQPCLRAVGIDPRAPVPDVVVTIDDVPVAADLDFDRVDMVRQGEGWILWDLRVAFTNELCCFNCQTGVMKARLRDAADNVFEGVVTLLLSGRGVCPDPDACCLDPQDCVEPAFATACEGMP